MTTRITVEPAGHTIEVVTLDSSNTGPSVATILSPGSAPYETYIHAARTLVIRELPTAG